MQTTDPLFKDLEDCCPPRLRSVVARCAAGEIPPNVALMQLLIEAGAPEEAQATLERAHAVLADRDRSPSAAEHLRRTLDLLRGNPQSFRVVKSVIAGVEHGAAAVRAADGVAHWAAAFDRMAKASPEGGVALYCLGNPDLLHAATTEIVDRMRLWGLLGRERSVLDIGCGIGRFEEALAPEVRDILGIDVSGGMIAIAQERCAQLPNVRLRTCSGLDLGSFEDESFDLVLAADVFPYLVQAGSDLAREHVVQAARLLKPQGCLLVLNFSYRGEPSSDRSDAQRFASDAGLRLIRSGTRDFTLWDGLTFQFRKGG